jgi:hypothetical protein
LPVRSVFMILVDNPRYRRFSYHDHGSSLSGATKPNLGTSRIAHSAVQRIPRAGMP